MFAPRIDRSLAALCLCTLSGACSSSEVPTRLQAQRAETPLLEAHYWDADDNSLERYDSVWNALGTFYRSNRPKTIHVHYRSNGTSTFDPKTSSITLSVASFEGRSPRATIAHESSHLFLADLTDGASTLEELRFIDEGLASILEHEVGEQKTTYRERALHVAAGRMKDGPITFERMAHWNVFFGSGDKNPDFGAYDVGASFVFYVREHFGDPRFVDFVRSLGKTRSLGASAREVLGVSLTDLEAAWVSYVGQVKIEPPRVVEQNPLTSSRDVVTSIHQISVKLDVPMDPKVCLLTPCDEGICFDHARWTDERTLTVSLDKPLLAKHHYRLSLGTPSCRLQSRAGDELPVTEWQFDTE